jgi:hypothetical protein
MATLNSAKRNTSGLLEAGIVRPARVLDFVLDLGADATMGTATDDINLATLPGGAVVLAVTVQQLTAGTGSGTLVGRVGSTTVTGTLGSEAAAGTVAATVPAAIPLVVPAAGAELNLLGATAVRTDGKVRVVVVIAEGDRSPRQAEVADRDTLA